MRTNETTIKSDISTDKVHVANLEGSVIIRVDAISNIAYLDKEKARELANHILDIIE